MRGEHCGMKEGPAGPWGSSPHARGAHLGGRVERPRLGIIPACAGSTAVCRASCRTSWDHPRMRGEHALGGLVDSALEGSSPHARGALHHLDERLVEHGIIPACAGSTSPQARTRRTSRDHPRMRGEHPRRRLQRSRILGSSPHARGAHGRAGGRHPRGGIIPACAGSTRSVPSPRR